MMFKADILKCPRCGDFHKNVNFRKLPSPIRDIDGDWTHAARCSRYNNKIVMRHAFTQNEIMTVAYGGRIIHNICRVTLRVGSVTIEDALRITDGVQKYLTRVSGVTFNVGAHHAEYAAVR